MRLVAIVGCEQDVRQNRQGLMIMLVACMTGLIIRLRLLTKIWLRDDKVQANTLSVQERGFPSSRTVVVDRFDNSSCLPYDALTH